jgi:hypothetical protein
MHMIGSLLSQHPCQPTAKMAPLPGQDCGRNLLAFKMAKAGFHSESLVSLTGEFCLSSET